MELSGISLPEGIQLLGIILSFLAAAYSFSIGRNLKKHIGANFWDKKMEVYTLLTESLSEMLTELDEAIRLTEMGAELSPKSRTFFSKTWGENTNILSKYSYLGGLLISETAAEALKKYVDIEFDAIEHLADQDEIDRHLKQYLSPTLEKLVEEAKKDLNLKNI